MQKLINFLKDESGASAAEYVLILGVIGTAVVLGANALGGAISGAMTTAGAFITGHEVS